MTIYAQQTILLTGGAGYIGSHTAYVLTKNNYNVIVLDKKNPDVHLPDVIYYQGDCGDDAILSMIISKHNIDTVMHFAASIEVGESVTNPRLYYDNNVNKTIVLLNALLKHNIKKFVFSSSAAVYGNPLHEIIDESHPINPINPYGKTKAIIECILPDFFQAYDMQYVALRYFNVSGSLFSVGLGECHNPETHLIPRIIQSFLQKAPFTIFGDNYPTADGTCVRDYVHVLDVAAAHLKALEFLTAKHQSGTFNIGTGIGHSVREIIDKMQLIVKQSITYKTIGKRPGDPSHLIAYVKKAEQELGWKPQYNLDDIIKSAYEFELIKTKKSNPQ